MPDTQLQIGKQSEAARQAHAAAQSLGETLSDLGTSLEGHFDGFRGGAAAATVEAVQAWFEGAQQLFTVLQEYAEKLVDVDKAENATETAAQARFTHLAARLGAH